MTGPAAVEVEGLEVDLGGARVLGGIDLRVATGEMLVVVGPNGAGKTTLLRCLDGLVRPTAGRILVEGRPIADYRRRHLARTVSYVPQADTRAVHYTVAAFVEMGRYPHVTGWSGPGKADLEAVGAALEMTETGHLVDRTLESLSGGERQRVVLAAALAQGGRILLLDEPTSFLDVRHRVGVQGVLERLHREQGLTVIAVTHDLNGLLPAADRVLALKGGRVAGLGPPERLLDEAFLERVFDTPFQLVPATGRRLPVAVARGSQP